MQRPPFDRARIDHLAQLSSLSLSDAEATALAHDLGAIVAYVEQLAAVDTSSLDPEAGDLRAQPPPLTPVAWRDDVVTPGLSHEDALRGAPRATDAGFAVPGFVPGGASKVK